MHQLLCDTALDAWHAHIEARPQKEGTSVDVQIDFRIDLRIDGQLDLPL